MGQEGQGISVTHYERTKARDWQRRGFVRHTGCLLQARRCSGSRDMFERNRAEIFFALAFAVWDVRGVYVLGLLWV